MTHTHFNRRDIDFLLFDVLQAHNLTSHARYAGHDRASFDAILDTAARIAVDHFAPHAAKSDANEPQFQNGRVILIPEIKAALQAYVDAGLMAASFDENLGGLQLPVVVAQALSAMFYGANIATAAYPMLTIGAANLLARFGNAQQHATYLKPMVEGRWFGTMCLSEPQAGSSLADIQTKATPTSEGRYLITGTKMWISGGEHDLSENIVHLVLAKIPGGPSGVKGISLFCVPKYLVNADGSLAARNGVVLAGLNHKMGYRGTVNTVLNFGESAPCYGQLVGEAHQGLSYMFHMMNEARIGVGLGATMCGMAGYLNSLLYARERRQGRPIEAKDPASPQTPIIHHADVRRLLLTQKAYVEGALPLCLFCAHLVDLQRTLTDANELKRVGLLLDLLTPVAKSWPSEFCLEANKHAIQVLGGYGYTRDFPLERLYRDNRLNPIHEGTHGIQGLDLLGRKVAAEKGAALDALGALIAETVFQAPSTLSDEAAALTAAWQRTRDVTAKLVAVRAKAPVTALADATLYLDMFGHIVIAWLWLKQASVASALGDDPFYQGKLAACRFFFRRELPKTKTQAELLARLDDTALAVTNDAF